LSGALWIADWDKGNPSLFRTKSDAREVGELGICVRRSFDNTVSDSSLDLFPWKSRIHMETRYLVSVKINEAIKKVEASTLTRGFSGLAQLLTGIGSDVFPRVGMQLDVSRL